MSGITIHEPERAWQGYTLFCESFIRPRAEGEPAHPIYLIDMDGEPVHRWEVEHSLQSFCRLLPNGHLVYPTRDRAEIEGGTPGVREVDPDANLVRYYPCRVDHDFHVLENGNLLLHVITENYCPPLGPGMKRQCWMIEVTPEDELVWEWRAEEHLAELRALLGPDGWNHVMERATGEFAFDWAHNNTLQPIPSNLTAEKEKQAGHRPRFQPGNIFFSYRSCDVIGVIERETGHIVWAWGPGELDGQHKPHVLPNGNVLIFDNGTLRGWSRVIELNPLTEQIEWEYRGDEDHPFFSPYISSAQRLPNGNTLICEGGNARLFEVTPEGEIVWEFRNPYHVEQATGTVYRCLRYPESYVAPLL